ncbi:unnamed protein product [Bursaphelenchus okinawaensis]|uniref:Uncharacterized protein n=1 Tax=Bursaphelenchus okinawaensis TaxID=465554 RepID=A0A811LTX0_9BILA|nr:unnamed protein product [Bursaphelenchus okinawaensis]CAG9127970.1 unnamed protein product [Bursaphelenchus okinawaensis]
MNHQLQEEQEVTRLEAELKLARERTENANFKLKIRQLEIEKGRATEVALYSRRELVDKLNEVCALDAQNRRLKQQNSKLRQQLRRQQPLQRRRRNQQGQRRPWQRRPFPCVNTRPLAYD